MHAQRGFSTMAASVPLASFVAEVKGVKFYDCRGLRACRGECVVMRRQPYNAYDVNCVEVRLQ